MIHARGDLDAFLRGETRLVYARRAARPHAEPVELPQGEARAWRLRGESGFLCPMPGCQEPAMTIVARAPKRRDGFRHIAGGAGGHSPESVSHQQGKARMAAWLRAKHPDWQVEIEAVLPGRERVADVLATDPSGRRFAFEVQYSALNPEEWEERTRSYGRMGVLVTWLFGHVGPNFIASREGWVTLTETQRVIRDAGRQVLWLDPVSGQIATAAAVRRVDGMTRTTDEPAEGEHLTLATRGGFVAPMPLDDVELTPRGMDAEVLRGLRASTRAWEVAHRAWQDAQPTPRPVRPRLTPIPPAPRPEGYPEGSGQLYGWLEDAVRRRIERGGIAARAPLPGSEV